MVSRIGSVAAVLALSIGCATTKTITVEYFEEVAVSGASRPMPIDYRIAPTMAVAEVCDDDEPAVVNRLIDKARGDHDGLVQLVVQRTRTERWNHPVNMWGVPIGGGTIEAIDVCYEVSGYPVDLPVSRPAAELTERPPEP